MKATWLGQAGLLFETGCLKIMIDPYFSNSVGRRQGKNRRIPIAPAMQELKPDVLICTHNHPDRGRFSPVRDALGAGRIYLLH